MASLCRRPVILYIALLAVAGRFSGTGAGSLADELGICAASVRIHGYKCEEINVTTKDGYILSVQRIPEGRFGGGTGGTKSNKHPILIQHGVLVDAVTWLLNSPEQNLPMILADNGYDVWMANTRGTRFSRRHTSLDPRRREFWNWSWDELVTYDMPAVFDYVFRQTGKKIDYIGHSLGTLLALASMSEGNLVGQLKSVALLSPIAYLSHMTTPLGNLAARSILGEIFTDLGIAEFNLRSPEVIKFFKPLCAHPGINCYDLLTTVTGRNCCLNTSTVSLFLMNEPQATSTKNLVHLSQTVRSGALAKFNYGRSDYNLMHYGETRPPIYNLSNIPRDIPIFLSYGGRDALSDVRDVGRLLDDLKFHDVDKLSVQFIENYAHADFNMGFNAKDLVYRSVLTFFNRQSAP